MDGGARIWGCHRPAHTRLELSRLLENPSPSLRTIFKILNSQNILFEFRSVLAVTVILFDKAERSFFTFNFLDLQSFAPLLEILRKNQLLKEFFKSACKQDNSSDPKKSHRSSIRDSVPGGFNHIYKQFSPKHLIIMRDFMMENITSGGPSVVGSLMK